MATSVVNNTQVYTLQGLSQIFNLEVAYMIVDPVLALSM